MAAFIADKAGLLGDLEGRTLELGCGVRKAHPSYVGVDRLDSPAVDIVGDVFDVLAEIPPRTLGGIYSAHFFEHIVDLDSLMAELARVLRPEATADIIVPHFGNPYFYSDPTHVRSFGLYTFSYLVHDDILRRQVPAYGPRLGFALESVDLTFKSARQFYVRHALKYVVGRIVNLSRWTKEFYEENLAFTLPCYEVHFVLRRMGG